MNTTATINSTVAYFTTQSPTHNTTAMEDIETPAGPQWVPLETFIGLVLAFSSCLFIGVSVIYKKLALKDIEAGGGTRAVDGGYGYLRMPKWWLGISLMGLGELTNFVAYIFAPAILVTPLGVFSIVCTAALSPYFLKERLGKLGIVGCVLVLVGCIIVTLCGPKDREIASMEELQSQLLHPGFLVYAALVVVVSIVFMLLVPRYGHRYVLLYITICSSFGSLSVMFCKGVGLALKQTVMGINEFTNWATWVCLISLVACLVVETIYMQRALDLFNSSVFMSINYVLFTSLVIIASSILYTELREIGVKNIILTLLGFVVNIAALFLLHLDKEANTTDQGKEDSQNDLESSPQMNKKSSMETSTPLLSSRVPASPLAGLNLPNTMFPVKSNSCMSLISQNSISHHRSHSATDNDHHGGITGEDEDNHNTLTEGNMGGNGGCMCEVPLLSELQTSNTTSTTKHLNPVHCTPSNNNNNTHHTPSHNNNNNNRHHTPSPHTIPSHHSTPSSHNLSHPTPSRNSLSNTNSSDSRRSSYVNNLNTNSFRNNALLSQPGDTSVSEDENEDSDGDSMIEQVTV